MSAFALMKPPTTFQLPLSLSFPNPARSGYVSFGPFARLEVDSNHWHKDFQSFALTSWATWTTFQKCVFSSSNSALPYQAVEERRSTNESRPGTGLLSFGQAFFAIDATKKKKEAPHS